jgi:radical SAM superfamily enzyme YgiQ (UPF0313 family)
MKTCIVLVSDQLFLAHKSKDWSLRLINHGVALLIAYAKKQGFDLELVDTRRLNNWAEYVEAVKGFDIVCFSVNTIAFNNYKICLNALKEVNPSAKVIVGGVHPTVKLNDFINDMRVDYIVQGEGEVALTLLLTYLRKEVKNIPRVHQRQHVKLDEIPFIDRSLWEDEYPYKMKFSGQPPFVTILASRACTMRCKFCAPCSQMLFGNDERRRSVANVIEELTELDQLYHFKSWMIHDDGFLQNLPWIKLFLEEYKAKEFGPRPLIIQCRANYIVSNPELIAELQSVLGLELAIVGFESGSDKMLAFLRKGTTRKINIDAANILHKNGIKVFANILLGIPTESHGDIDLTMSMVREIKPNHFSPATFSPYPGSELHDYCMKNNLILTEYADRHMGTQKLKGIDYDYINKAINNYNQNQHNIKSWVKYSNNVVAKVTRALYKNLRAK